MVYIKQVPSDYSDQNHLNLKTDKYTYNFAHNDATNDGC